MRYCIMANNVFHLLIFRVGPMRLQDLYIRILFHVEKMIFGQNLAAI